MKRILLVMFVGFIAIIISQVIPQIFCKLTDITNLFESFYEAGLSDLEKTLPIKEFFLQKS
jgi:hypothetical protein